MKPLQLTGRRFGRLVVLNRASNASDGRPQWLCQCDCGGEKVVRSASLMQGHTKSCGCLQAESARAHAPLAAAALTTHGMSRTRLSTIFKGIVQRCTNPNFTAYKDYGGRGICICPEWSNNAAAFFAWAIANGYEEGLTIDRKDNDKGYSPENCRWVDKVTQSNNTRRNRVICHDGREMTLSQWARYAGIKMHTLWNRLDLGWTFSKAISTPVRGSHK